MGRGTAVLPAGERRAWQTRSAWIVAACTVAMAAIGVIGVADHSHKSAVLYSLREAPWYCEHERARCDEARHAASVEDRWNARETGYKTSLVLVGALIVLIGAGAAYRMRFVLSPTLDRARSRARRSHTTEDLGSD